MCSPGWRGDACDLIECPNDCSGKGKCEKDGTCNCDKKFTGVDCSKPSCPDNCSNRGECLLNEESNKYTCQCIEGYSGDSCRQCSRDFFCKGRGECYDSFLLDKPSQICHCDGEFFGRHCEVSTCPSSSIEICSGHGKCKNSGSNPKSYNCECDENWTGHVRLLLYVLLLKDSFSSYFIV